MIDFPTNPSHGNTYEYLGVIYTYKKLVGDPGFWQVSTVGTYGPALASEINAGTDPVKYVTPLELADSDYINNGDAATQNEVNVGTDWFKYITPGALALSQYEKKDYIDKKLSYIQLATKLRVWTGPAEWNNQDIYFTAGINLAVYVGATAIVVTLKYLYDGGVDGGVKMFHNSFTQTGKEDYLHRTSNIIVPIDSNGLFKIYWHQFHTQSVTIDRTGY